MRIGRFAPYLALPGQVLVAHEVSFDVVVVFVERHLEIFTDELVGCDPILRHVAEITAVSTHCKLLLALIDIPTDNKLVVAMFVI